jgi:hypothetical protein
VRAFWLTLFAFGAVAVLAAGWRSGEPLTAAAFVTFFVSRVWRSIVKRPLNLSGTAGSAKDDPGRRVTRFLLITAAGWLASGALAVAAALTGEGQEWLYVAPLFLVMGALNLCLLLGARDSIS